MKIKAFWLLLFCLPAILGGVPAGQAQSTIVNRPAVTRQTDDYTAIDQHALHTPKSAERTIASLAAYLTRPARNDREKARAIFRWITANIAYDDVAAMTGTRLGPGTLYGAIPRLENAGLIEAVESGDRRRPYRLTGKGAESLRARVETLRRLSIAGLARLGSP